MLQIKLAALLMLPLAFFCSLASAQEREPESVAKSDTPTQLKPQTRTPPSLKTQPRQKVSAPGVAPTRQTMQVQGAVTDLLPTACPTPVYAVPPGDLYGAYVPYVAPDQPTACTTPNAQPQGKIARPYVPGAAPIETISPIQSAVTDVLPPACPTPVYAVPPGDIYGAYHPYVAPAGCTSPIALAASSNASHPNSSAVQKQQPASLINSTSPSLFKLAPPTGNDLALAPAAAPSPGDSPAEGGYVRPIPTQRAPTIPQEIRPFRSLAIGFKADTLGLGVEFATPMAYKINLRSSINFFAFDDPFNIDGVDYNARLHFKSSETTVDWFPHGEGGLHISPGILYVKNTLSAPASVGPGQTFTLGTQTFVNSVDDPVNGTSSVVYARKFAPMLLIGYGNIIPRTGRHLSFPFEFGAAYTGAPQISVALNGTACTTEGCVNFATNSDAQKFLKQEVNSLNQDLKKFPVFPILSMGVAYHF